MSPGSITTSCSRSAWSWTWGDGGGHPEPFPRAEVRAPSRTRTKEQVLTSTVQGRVTFSCATFCQRPSRASYRAAGHSRRQGAPSGDVAGREEGRTKSDAATREAGEGSRETRERRGGARTTIRLAAWVDSRSTCVSSLAPRVYSRMPYMSVVFERGGGAEVRLVCQHGEEMVKLHIT